MRSIHKLLLVAGLLAVTGTSGCSGPEAAGACSSSSDCSRGLACADNGDGATCSPFPCGSNDDCLQEAGFTEACLLEDEDGNWDPDAEGFCTHQECRSDRDCDDGVCQDSLCYADRAGPVSCSTRADCPSGQVCISGTCDDPTGFCSSDNECPEGEICGAANTCEAGTPACDPPCSGDQECIDGACVGGNACDPPCSGGEECVDGACVPTADCTPACGAGETCQDGTCVPLGGGGGLCDTCAADDDCGGPDDYCVFLPGREAFCGLVCEVATDCPSGFTCIVADTQGHRQCVPASGTCSGCLIDGCGAGEFCDSSDGTCKPQLGSCEQCSAPNHCQTGLTCAVAAGVPSCLQDCTGGGSCPVDTACQNVSGVDVCVPSSGGCGGGSCEIEDSDCTAPSRFVDPARCVCVECLDTSDCGGTLTCTASGACLSGGEACTTSAECAPGYCQAGVCVDCLTPSDCGTGEFCVRGECQGCECPEGQRCDSSGTCVEVPDTGDCASDADCQNAAMDLGGDGVNAACDPAIGCFTRGGCSGATFVDVFNAPCPVGTVCAPNDLFSVMLGGPGDVCTGCTVGDDSTCRAGETCAAPLFPLPGMDQPKCTAGGGLPFP